MVDDLAQPDAQPLHDAGAQRQAILARQGLDLALGGHVGLWRPRKVRHAPHRIADPQRHSCRGKQADQRKVQTQQGNREQHRVQPQLWRGDQKRERGAGRHALQHQAAVDGHDTARADRQRQPEDHAAQCLAERPTAPHPGHGCRRQRDLHQTRRGIGQQQRRCRPAGKVPEHRHAADFMQVFDFWTNLCAVTVFRRQQQRQQSGTGQCAPPAGQMPTTLRRGVHHRVGAVDDDVQQGTADQGADVGKSAGLVKKFRRLADGHAHRGRHGHQAQRSHRHPAAVAGAQEPPNRQSFRQPVKQHGDRDVAADALAAHAGERDAVDTCVQHQPRHADNQRRQMHPPRRMAKPSLQHRRPDQADQHQRHDDPSALTQRVGKHVGQHQPGDRHQHEAVHQLQGDTTALETGKRQRSQHQHDHAEAEQDGRRET